MPTRLGLLFTVLQAVFGYGFGLVFVGGLFAGPLLMSHPLFAGLLTLWLGVLCLLFLAGVANDELHSWCARRYWARLEEFDARADAYRRCQ